LPSIEDIVARALLFERVLTEDPVAGREELRRLFADGKVLCQPQPDVVYVAEGKLLPLALFSMRVAPETPKARDSGESSGLRVSRERAACSIIGCAGALRALAHDASRRRRTGITCSGNHKPSARARSAAVAVARSPTSRPLACGS
jgi:hypothetical protein